MAVDHCATACIGLHAAKRGNRFEALEPIRQGIRERFGGIGEGVARGLRLRHDHGSNYLADDFQQEVAFFGIESSPSFVREPEGNGVAERFIRTLKENLLWVRSFETIEELRLALLEFKRTYNEQWMLEKYDYRSPAQVRRDLLGLGRGGVEANTVKPLSKNPGAVHEVVALVISRRNRIALDGAGEATRHPFSMFALFVPSPQTARRPPPWDVADQPFVSISASTMLDPCQRECLARHRCNSTAFTLWCRAGCCGSEP